MEIAIDRESCGDCMLCVEVYPELFEMRESKVEPLLEQIPPELNEHCLGAAALCPTEAIELIATAG